MDDQPAEWKAGIDCIKEAKEWVDAIQQSRDGYQRAAVAADRSGDEDRFQAEEDRDYAYELMNKIQTSHNERIQAMRKLWLGEVEDL